MYNKIESQFPEIFEENGLLVYDYDNRSVIVKVAQSKDISPLAKFIHDCKRTNNSKDILNETELISDLEKSLRSGIGYDSLPPSCFVLIALETYTEGVYHGEEIENQCAQDMECRTNIRGAAIVTSYVDIYHAVSNNKIEELYIEGEPSDIGHALALVLSVMSLDGEMHVNDENLFIRSQNSKKEY